MKEKFVLTGMHCKSCEMLIEDEIREVVGVKKVAGDFKSGVIEIEHAGKASKKDFEKIFEELKYKVKSYEKIV